MSQANKLPKEIFVHPNSSPYRSQVFAREDLEQNDFINQLIPYIEKSAYDQLLSEALKLKEVLDELHYECLDNDTIHADPLFYAKEALAQWNKFRGEG